MRKIITIGESVLDTFFKDGKPVKASVGGRIANATASLGMLGVPVAMCSECCADSVGDMIVDFFEKHNVDVKSIDRYTDGATPISVIFEQEDGSAKLVNYGVYPNDRFDVIWPRIDENDIIIFGSLYAIDAPQRDRLFELVQYAVERKAIILYMPGFQHGVNFRITRVLTAILENLEVSNLVVAHDRDINDIFPGEDAEKAYHSHIEFYCPTYVHIHDDQSVDVFVGKEHYHFASPDTKVENWLGWQSGFSAGLVYQILLAGITRDQMASLDAETVKQMVDAAFDFAAQSAAAADNCITAAYAEGKAKAYAEAEAQRQQA